jgi:hypothetical protein
MMTKKYDDVQKKILINMMNKMKKKVVEVFFDMSSSEVVLGFGRRLLCFSLLYMSAIIHMPLVRIFHFCILNSHGSDFGHLIFDGDENSATTAAHLFLLHHRSSVQHRR